MALGCAMTHFAGYGFVAARRPLRNARRMTGQAVTRRLVSGLLRGNFRYRIGAVVAVLVERIDRKKRLRNQRHYQEAKNQANESEYVFGHARLSSQRVRPSRFKGDGFRSEKNLACFNS